MDNIIYQIVNLIVSQCLSIGWHRVHFDYLSSYYVHLRSSNSICISDHNDIALHVPCMYHYDTFNRKCRKAILREAVTLQYILASLPTKLHIGASSKPGRTLEEYCTHGRIRALPWVPHEAGG